MMRLMRYLLIVCLALLPTGLLAQGLEAQEDTTTIEIKVKMTLFKSELSDYYDQTMHYLNVDDQEPMSQHMQDYFTERIKYLTEAMKSFENRWNTYSQAQQVYIAEDDSLLAWVDEIQQLQVTINDSLTSKQQQYDYMVGFCKAEEFILGQDSVYKHMYNEAMSLSMVKKLAAQLEKLKAEEQLIFADIQTNYDKAKEAAALFSGLADRMQVIDDKYIQLKSVSGKIQEAAFKPFIQRVKDYLIGLAAVAILLMFISMLSARIKSLKQSYEQAKKMKQMLKGQQQQDYPTI